MFLEAVVDKNMEDYEDIKKILEEYISWKKKIDDTYVAWCWCSIFLISFILIFK